MNQNYPAVCIDLPADDNAIWQQRSYRAVDIRDKLVFWSNEASTHPDFHGYRGDYMRFSCNPDESLGFTTDFLGILGVYFDFFDKIFFMNKLAGYCTISLNEDLPYSRLGDCTRMGTAGLGMARIRLSKKALCPEENGFRQRCVETLLHEMLHAIFELYAYPSDRDQYHVCGPRGHGPCWQTASAAMQKAMREQCYGKFDINAEYSFVCDLAHRAAKDKIRPEVFEIWLVGISSRSSENLLATQVQGWGFSWEIMERRARRKLALLSGEDSD